MNAVLKYKPMSKYQKLYHVMIFYALQFIDALLTLAGIQEGAIELNWFKYFDNWVFIKFGLATLSLVVLFNLNRFHLVKYLNIAFAFLCAFNFIVVIYVTFF